MKDWIKALLLSIAMALLFIGYGWFVVFVAPYIIGVAFAAILIGLAVVLLLGFARLVCGKKQS